MTSRMEAEGYFHHVIPASFIRRFRGRCRFVGDECLVYGGGRTVRLPIDLDLVVEFVTPRRASYLIEHGRLPEREIGLNCGEATCVNPRHFVEGRTRRFGLTVIDDGIRTSVRAETGLSEYAVARKYGISRNTVRRIKAGKPEREMAKTERPVERPKPKYRSYRF